MRGGVGEGGKGVIEQTIPRGRNLERDERRKFSRPSPKINNWSQLVLMRDAELLTRFSPLL